MSRARLDVGLELSRRRATHSMRRRGGTAGAALRHHRSSSESGADCHPSGIGQSRRRSRAHSNASHPPSSPPRRRMRGNWSGSPWRRSGVRRRSSTGGSMSSSSGAWLRRVFPVRRSAHWGTTSQTSQRTPPTSVKVRCAMARQARCAVVAPEDAPASSHPPPGHRRPAAPPATASDTMRSSVARQPQGRCNSRTPVPVRACMSAC